MRGRSLFFICLIFLEACGGGGGSSSQAVSGVLISPRPLAVQKGNTLQFTATDRSGQVIPQSSLTWSVDGTDQNGTVNSNGFYSAPANIPPQNSVTVRATSVADSTKNDAVSFYILTGRTLGFSSSYDITSTISPQGTPPPFHIAVFNQNSYIIWATTNPTNGTGLWYAKLDMNGKFLTPPHNILNDIKLFLGTFNPENPVIVLDNQIDSNGDPGVYIAWDDNLVSSNFQIYMVKGPNGKSCSYSPCFELLPAPYGRIDSPNPGVDQITPSIAFNPSGKLEFAWTEVYGTSPTPSQFIKYKELNSNGVASTLQSIQVTPATQALQMKPAIGVDHSGNISVSWLDFGGTTSPNILYSRMAVGYYSFGPANLVETDTLAPSDTFSMALDYYGQPYLAWSKATPANGTGIYYATTSDFAKFTKPVNLTSGGYRPTIKVDFLNYLYFTWDDGVSIYFQKTNVPPVQGSLSANPQLKNMGINSIMNIDDGGRVYLLYSTTGSPNSSIYFIRGN